MHVPIFVAMFVFARWMLALAQPRYGLVALRAPEGFAAVALKLDQYGREVTRCPGG